MKVFSMNRRIPAPIIVPTRVSDRSGTLVAVTAVIIVLISVTAIETAMIADTKPVTYSLTISYHLDECF